MSFPPPPPMAVSPMMTQGYTFTPMGMMPMPMGVMPHTAMPPMMISTPPPQITPKLLPPQILNPIFEEPKEKPPVTTVFVGNISERAPDTMIRMMLQKCGLVLSWKRVQGASGKLQAFGFCEYERPESTLRCIRMLNEWQIADKKLVVKVDAKTKTLLDEYLRKRSSKEETKKESKKESENVTENETDTEKEKVVDKEEGEVKTESEDVDEVSADEDTTAKADLERIMAECASVLAKEPLVEPEKPFKGMRDKRKEDTDASMDHMELEEEQKDLITKEIRLFRDAHKIDAVNSGP